MSTLQTGVEGPLQFLISLDRFHLAQNGVFNNLRLRYQKPL